MMETRPSPSRAMGRAAAAGSFEAVPRLTSAAGGLFAGGGAVSFTGGLRDRGETDSEDQAAHKLSQATAATPPSREMDDMPTPSFANRPISSGTAEPRIARARGRFARNLSDMVARAVGAKARRRNNPGG